MVFMFVEVQQSTTMASIRSHGEFQHDHIMENFISGDLQGLGNATLLTLCQLHFPHTLTLSNLYLVDVCRGATLHNCGTSPRP